ncbi:glycosyl transferase [Sphaerisporangium siamense]|uniref:UDP:flavonoid glycosyltransferase YjiC (YdhE family) n=1 Tax=Sphaerisporangium siamense TaxID=795645 RepID=A0A7W7DBA3_9ACTN|nr:nucleotide disphospho-sugar-binding domain-containing protein [Sphaerisporangium siamense]MBB4702426.1 UDP:flavonoid glycosyltransferase YjiC (YdhE family) [Sphaerisporangium siamense]GII88939.1 glycosyl transferase [Sphaerisporangium siamense]
MRVMLTVWPQMCHLYPVIPYAQALQNAGHEVVVAGPPGAVEHVVAAGLTAVVTRGDEAPQSAQDWSRDDLVTDHAELARLADALGVTPADRDNWDVFYQFLLFGVKFHLPPRPSADNLSLVEFARAWQPDLVLWDPWFPAGAVAARASGAAHARILMAPDYSGWAVQRFADARAAGTHESNPLAAAMRPLAERYGVEVDDELLLGQWTIDPMPEGMRLPVDTSSLPVRWIPYNGGGEKPEWLYRRPERPRVALSVGVSTRLYFKGEWRTPKIFDAVADLDIELVATLNKDQLEGVTKIPANVRTVDYVPLVQLLPTCSLSINHGSSGTFWTSVAANLPQLVGDTDERQGQAITGEGEDAQFVIPERHILSKLAAKYIVDNGAGLRLDHQTQSVDEIRNAIVKLLEDPSFTDGANSVHDEWLAKPTPAGIVADLEKLTARNRRRG